MAIIDVRQLRSFEFSETKAAKGSIQRTGSVELLVLNNATPDFGAIASDTTSWPNFFNRKIPQINDFELVGGIDFYVTSRKFAYADNENEYAVKVTVRYDSFDPEINEPGGGDGSSPEDPPEEGDDSDAGTRWTYSTMQVQVPLTDEGVFGDLGAKPATNSAGDFVDGLTEDRALQKWTYTNPVALNVDIAALHEYVNKVNSRAFRGQPARTVRCMGFNAEFDEVNQTWNVSVEFLYDPKVWKVDYYDVGYNEIVGGKRRAILDTQGNPVSKPVPLDGTGKALPIGDITVGSYSPAKGLVTLTAYPYKQKDLNDLFADGKI